MRPRLLHVGVAARWLSAAAVGWWIAAHGGEAGIGASAALAPWIFAAFAELQRMIVRRGGRRPAAAVSRLHRLLLVALAIGWVAAATVHHFLFDRLWIAGPTPEPFSYGRALF